jgi:crotonobetainyl-CoA:carnitine CoA-transferase CaiB-like acyl-CoA transferase
LTLRLTVPQIGPLDGLRVLDISNLFAAPQVAAILGDFGADVIKVERPEGDPLRQMGASRDGHSLMWAFVNRNKRGITLDIGSTAGQEIFRRLVAQVDVVVENLPVAVQRDWHCTYDELAALHPGLVVVSVSCYGQDGPYQDRPGAGTLAEAFGGLTFMTGEADGPPMLPSVPVGDLLTGMAGAFGAVLACYHRAVGGGGQHVDVSMYEPVLQLLSSTVAAYRPGEPAPARFGSRVRGGVPRNVYCTADRQWIVVSGTTDAQVARILTVMGCDTDEMRIRFGTSAARLQGADELDAMVADWIGRNNRDQVLAALLDARVPAAPVNDVPTILADPHVMARDDVVVVEDVALGPIKLIAPAPRLRRTPGAIRSPGPAKGADNDEIYRGWLGLGADELERLQGAAVV